MAAGYHSNQQHSDGCLGTLQNIVVTFVVVIAMGSTDGGKKRYMENEREGLDSINTCWETKRRPESKMNREWAKKKKKNTRIIL